MFLQNVWINLLGYNLSQSRRQQYDTYIIPQFALSNWKKNHEYSDSWRRIEPTVSRIYKFSRHTFSSVGGMEDWNRVANTWNKNRIRGFPSFKDKRLTSLLGPCRISGVGRWIVTAWDGFFGAKNVSLTALSQINRTCNKMPPFNHKGSSVQIKVFCNQFLEITTLDKCTSATSAL